MNMGLLKQMKDLFPTLVASLLLFSISFFVQGLVTNTYLRLFVGILSGVSFYMIFTYLLKYKEWNDVKWAIEQMRVKKNGNM